MILSHIMFIQCLLRGKTFNFLFSTLVHPQSTFSSNGHISILLIILSLASYLGQFYAICLFSMHNYYKNEGLLVPYVNINMTRLIRQECSLQFFQVISNKSSFSKIKDLKVQKWILEGFMLVLKVQNCLNPRSPLKTELNCAYVKGLMSVCVDLHLTRNQNRTPLCLTFVII